MYNNNPLDPKIKQNVINLSLKDPQRMVHLTGVVQYNKMVNIRLFRIFQSCAWWTFFTKVEKVIILNMAYTITIFHEQLGLLIASTARYTMTVINNLGSYSVSPVKPAVKSDVPAPQLPIV